MKIGKAVDRVDNRPDRVRAACQHCIMSRSAVALSVDIPVASVDLGALDGFLRSERAPPDAMMLSDLDGFLTGIAVGPKIVMPSEWLPHIFGGKGPEFADDSEAKAVLGTIFGRYNEILCSIADGACEPILRGGRDGALLPFAWADGFLRAIMLRIDAWTPLFLSKRDGFLLLPILSLCSDGAGESLLGLLPDEDDRLTEQMSQCIPAAVLGIARYWREQGTKPPMRGPASPVNRPLPKVGRNEACPCGSGRKFKKCCGR